MANKQLIIDADYPKRSKVLALVLCIAHEIEAKNARLLKPFGISNTQLMILHALEYYPREYMTVNEIIENMVDDSPNVSRSIAGLEKMGLVSRSKNKEDKRIVEVSITKTGLQIHKEVDAVMENEISELPISEDDVDQIYEILKKM